MQNTKTSSEEQLDRVLKLLIRSGPMKAKELCAQLKISQPVFSRLIANKESILRIGRGPQTLYACYRLGTWGNPAIPVHLVDEQGVLQQPIATLHPLAPQGLYLESHSKILSSKFYKNIPYFFEDLRPAGFLGRLEPQLYPEHNFPPDITRWTEDHALTYLTRCGWDLIGNYLIGEQSCELYIQHKLQRTDVCDEKARAWRYPEIAQQVLTHGIPGSSAAGEHAKFLAIRKTDNKLIPVLVKFSPPLTDSISRRDADLLVCEHIAHNVLREHKKISAQSQLIWSNKENQQLFLEVERFDRNTSGGRRGLISLRALDLEFVGQLQSWSETAEALLKQKRIPKMTYENIVWLEVFGKLIGNTDRHHGNISFFCNGENIGPLAPAYDMLPMLYAPQNNQLFGRAFEPQSPKFAELPVWNDALLAAHKFWQEVQAHPEISTEFKKLTAGNEAKIISLSYTSSPYS